MLCPCGSALVYSGCCEPLVSSWHPANRPVTVGLEPGTVWRKLQIVDTADGGPDDETGIVEFRASCREADGSFGVSHERSRFQRVDGRWYYTSARY